MTTLAATALEQAYPGTFTAEQAQAWVAQRRALLHERRAGGTDLGLAVSSGCAATGARSHAQGLAEDAAHALDRLDRGLGTRCERCDAVLPLERLEGAPAAVRCTGCSRAYEVDTRYCR